MSDLSVFTEDNNTSKSQRRRVRWDERLSLIRNHFPNVDSVDWSHALQDTEVFAKVIRDILKAQQHLSRPEDERSIAGRSPKVEPGEGMLGWRELIGRSYSELPFVEAFRLIASDRSSGRQHSLSHIARKTMISRSRVHRLISGQEEADLRDMEMIAEAYNRKASFFLEYRVAVVIGFMAEKMESNPGVSTSLYEKIIGR